MHDKPICTCNNIEGNCSTQSNFSAFFLFSFHTAQRISLSFSEDSPPASIVENAGFFITRTQQHDGGVLCLSGSGCVQFAGHGTCASVESTRAKEKKKKNPDLQTSCVYEFNFAIQGHTLESTSVIRGERYTKKWNTFNFVSLLKVLWPTKLGRDDRPCQ